RGAEAVEDRVLRLALAVRRPRRASLLDRHGFEEVADARRAEPPEDPTREELRRRRVRTESEVDEVMVEERLDDRVETALHVLEVGEHSGLRAGSDHGRTSEADGPAERVTVNARTLPVVPDQLVRRLEAELLLDRELGIDARRGLRRRCHVTPPGTSEST